MRPAPPADTLPPRLARLRRHYLDKARPRIRKGLFRCFDSCHARYVRLHTRANAEHALTHARARILDALLEAEGYNISELAWRLDLTRQSVHRVVHEMERVRLLRLERRGRRDLLPKLTVLGRAIAKQAVGDDDDWWARLLRNFPTRDLDLVATHLRRYLAELPFFLSDPQQLEQPPFDGRLPERWRLDSD